MKTVASHAFVIFLAMCFAIAGCSGSQVRASMGT